MSDERKHDKNNPPGGEDEDPTRQEKKTELYPPRRESGGEGPTEAVPTEPGSGEGKTVLWRPGGKGAEGLDPMKDPPVGWVVVVDGPGKGSARALGYGRNTIGRNVDRRVCLDFGDKSVSSGHAIISYDAVNRKFSVKEDDAAKNLTYLNGQPVQTPQELHGGEEIKLGDTILRFVPLCGEDFDWADTEKKGEKEKQ